MFSDIIFKLAINRTISRKSSNWCKLNGTFLNNKWANKVIKRIKRDFKLNEDENNTLNL